MKSIGLNGQTFYSAGLPESCWTVASRDVRECMVNHRIWIFLGWQDIRQRYRRSLLGPLWITLSTAIMITTMSVLYGRLFKLPTDVYAPFLAIGTIVWGLISTILNEGCAAFISVESLIKQIKMPLTAHVCRMLWRNVIVFIHNIVILIPIWLVFDKNLNFLALVSSLLALSLVVINGVWTGVVLGAICARFRDVGQIVSNCVQIVFFVTPVMWLPSILDGRGLSWWLININPFYHILEIVRAPLLQNIIPIYSWVVVIGITIAGSFVGMFILGRYKRRVSYWL